MYLKVHRQVLLLHLILQVVLHLNQVAHHMKHEGKHHLIDQVAHHLILQVARHLKKPVARHLNKQVARHLKKQVAHRLIVQAQKDQPHHHPIPPSLQFHNKP